MRGHWRAPVVYAVIGALSGFLIAFALLGNGGDVVAPSLLLFPSSSSRTTATPQHRTVDDAPTVVDNIHHDNAHSPHHPIQSWAALFDHVLHTQFDHCIVEAVYDDAVLPQAIQWAARSVHSSSSSSAANDYLRFEDRNWSVYQRGARAHPPPFFSTLRDQLDTAQKMISIALGLIRRDAALSSLFHRIDASIATNDRHSGVTAASVLSQPLRRLIGSYVEKFRVALQLCLDVMAVKDRPRDVLLLLRQLRATRRQIGGGGGRIEPSPPSTYFYIDHAAPHYSQQSPQRGKFWSLFRPTLQCSMLQRLCDLPDECRFICNAPFMKEGDSSSSSPSSQQPRRHPLRFVGFGSNNEFLWEESLLRFFGPSRISDVTVFDCTLRGGKWMPPPVLTSAPIGFGVVSECLDQRNSANSISMAHLKSLLLQSRPTTATTTSTAITVKLRDGKEIDVHRYAATPHHTSTRGKHHRGGSKIDILKLDIEGYEFVVIPSWLRDYLSEMAGTEEEVKQRGEKGGGANGGGNDRIASPSDDDASSSFYRVDVLQMEFHRMGHRAKFGASISSALNAELLLLEIAALGFSMVGQERNYWDECCYEFSFAHFRYFMESEAAMMMTIYQP